MITERTALCVLTHDPKFFAQARRRTFWETPEFWLTGYTFPSFWRPANVPVRVGDKGENGLHLVQLWMRYRERAVLMNEVLRAPPGLPRCSDVDDQKFLELAWHAQARWLVTKDKALLVLARRKLRPAPCRIATPAGMAEMLAACK